MKIKRGTARRLGLRLPSLPLHLSLGIEDEPFSQAFQDWVLAVTAAKPYHVTPWGTRHAGPGLTCTSVNCQAIAKGQEPTAEDWDLAKPPEGLEDCRNPRCQTCRGYFGPVSDGYDWAPWRSNHRAPVNCETRSSRVPYLGLPPAEKSWPPSGRCEREDGQCRPPRCEPCPVASW